MGKFSGTLIIHTKVPERDDDSMSRLNIVFYDTSVFYILYLLFTFLLSTNLKGIITNGTQAWMVAIFCANGEKKVSVSRY